MALLVACTPSPKGAVQHVLDQRSQAMQEKNIQHYAQLIADDYMSRGRDKKIVVAEMRRLFKSFDKIQMKTHDRTVRIVADGHAECEQNYQLKVYADGEWRNITHREQLLLRHKNNGWKIIAGL
ncbi:MAG: nuclear transport factor 2 family protein [Mariprofundaceae bacterium]|nr:nuclear transport factor 2 family protein [Mariprofundaceae bacterium]